MGAKRTYWTKMNHDEARLAIDMMDDAEVGRWFRGWIAGAAGKQFDEEKIRSWKVEMRSGFRSGMESFADAQAYSDKQRERVAKRYQQTTETLPNATTVDSGSVFATKQPTESLPIQQRTTNNEQQEQPHPPNPPRGMRVAKVSGEECDAIYQAYPRHEARGEAIKAAAKALASVPFDALLAAVQEYATATAKWPPSDRKYIPLPASWLNARRWEDDRAAWVRFAPDSRPTRAPTQWTGFDRNSYTEPPRGPNGNPTL